MQNLRHERFTLSRILSCGAALIRYTTLLWFSSSRKVFALLRSYYATGLLQSTFAARTPQGYSENGKKGRNASPLRGRAKLPLGPGRCAVPLSESV
eukprot:3776718-Pyramimonas_sp.AAC.1